jgi:hypothetical protein
MRTGIGLFLGVVAPHGVCSTPTKRKTGESGDKSKSNGFDLIEFSGPGYDRVSR